MSNKHPVVSPFVADSSRPGQLQQVPLRAPHPSSMVPLMHAPLMHAPTGLHPCPPGMPYPTRPLMWHDILLLPPRVAQLCLPAPHAGMTSPHACMTSPQVCMASLPIPLTVAWHPPLTPQACMASPTSPLTLAGPPAPVPQARSHGALLLPDMLAWHHQPGPGMHGIIFLMRKLTWHDPPVPWAACHHLSSP